MTFDEIIARFECVRRKGAGRAQARCPSHADTTPSLTITEVEDRVLIHCQAGCPFESVIALAGLEASDLFFTRQTNGHGPPWEDVAQYVYRDEEGNPLFCVYRQERFFDGRKEKKFLQARYEAGRWVFGLNDTRRVPYRLPELREAHAGVPVFICEGEKDCDRLAAAGYVATCNPGGAGKWRDEYAAELSGLDAWVCEDNDAPGQAHVLQVARSVSGRATTVKLISFSDLPDFPRHGDVSDFLDRYGVSALVERGEVAPVWYPPADEASETAAPPQGARARSWKEFKEATFPTAEKLLGPLRRTEVGILTAKTNVGKTTLGLNFSVSVCTGEQFGEIIPAGRPRKVLYVDAETPPGVLRADISRMAESLTGGHQAQKLLEENLHLVAMDTLIDGEPLNLTKKAHLQWLEAEAQRVKADIVMLDTLVSLFELFNENDNAEIQRRVVKPARAMAIKLKIAVLINHHEGKGDQSLRDATDRPRGGSALTGGARMHWTLRRDPRDEKRVILSLGKVKGDQQGEIVLNYDHAARWYCPTDQAPPGRPLSLYDRVCRAVTNEMDIKEIVAIFPDYAAGTIENHLREAVKYGHLSQTKRGWYAPAGHNPPNPQNGENGKNGEGPG